MINTIFKAYDVRGIYPDQINEETTYKIGRAFVRFLSAKKIAVGRDIRQSSPALFEELKKGITEEGADVYDLGICTTPMVYFASGNLDIEGAIMLTASHNPAEYNGMKFCRFNAIPIGENSGLVEIKNIVLENNFPQTETMGQVFEKEIHGEQYLEKLSSFFNLGDKKFKIIIDTANAMGALELDIYKKFPANIELITIFEEFDSAFPNHEANPLKLEALQSLQKKVLEEKADLGIAYDGDGDRLGFVE